MNGLWSTLIGFFLGFTFGVGCALAVMYSIFMGGYRAAIKDSQLPSPPERFSAALAKISAPTPEPPSAPAAPSPPPPTPLKP